MLMVGTIQNLFITNKTKVLNFCSLNETYPRLHLLPPIDFLMMYHNNPESAEYEFDIQYASWILQDDNAFIDLMQIVFSMYQGYDVFLLISEDIKLKSYAESLLKLIQQRYGYNGFYITCVEDLFNAEDDVISGIHAMNIHDDKERLAYILEEKRQSLGGFPNEF